MPKIDHAEYEAATIGGDFKEFCPGAYVVRIQAVRTSWEEMDWGIRERVERTSDEEKAVLLIWDVAEGEFEGEFSRGFYLDGGEPDQRKDFMHQVLYTWDDLGDLRQFNDALEKSNPGFDPMAAFEADRWDMYIGKQFGIVVDGTHYTKENGYDGWKTRAKHWKVYSVDDIRSGKHAEPYITDKRTNKDEAPADNYADVPF